VPASDVIQLIIILRAGRGILCVMGKDNKDTKEPERIGKRTRANPVDSDDDDSEGRLYPKLRTRKQRVHYREVEPEEIPEEFYVQPKPVDPNPNKEKKKRGRKPKPKPEQLVPPVAPPT
jgi:hypothetical protein